MILKYSNQKFNTKTFVYLKCDKCGNEQRRKHVKYEELKTNPAWDMDYCEPCWVGVRQRHPEARKKMSKAIKDMIKRDPEWKTRISESSKGRINLGEKNGMKQEAARKKVSETRKKLMASGYNKEVSKQMKKAWADGSYDGVRVGQSKWHEYKHSNGETYKVQGTWELEFIKWLDQNDMKFECHKGRIPYIDDEGQTRSYYPDFYVYEWNSYVDIKNKYHYSLQKDKFSLIRKSNPDLNLRIILGNELREMNIIK